MSTEIDTIIGKTVTVYKIAESLNDRGDVTKSTVSTANIVCEIQVLRGDEAEVRSGILKPLDAIAFFKPTDSIEIGDEVVYQGAKYIVVGLYKEQLGSVEVYQEAHLSRIIE